MVREREEHLGVQKQGKPLLAAGVCLLVEEEGLDKDGDRVALVVVMDGVEVERLEERAEVLVEEMHDVVAGLDLLGRVGVRHFAAHKGGLHGTVLVIKYPITAKILRSFLFVFVFIYFIYLFIYFILFYLQFSGSRELGDAFDESDAAIVEIDDADIVGERHVQGLGHAADTERHGGMQQIEEMGGQDWNEDALVLEGPQQRHHRQHHRRQDAEVVRDKQDFFLQQDAVEDLHDLLGGQAMDQQRQAVLGEGRHLVRVDRVPLEDHIAAIQGRQASAALHCRGCARGRRRRRCRRIPRCF